MLTTGALKEVSCSNSQQYRTQSPLTRNDDLYGCVTPTSSDVSKFYNNLHIGSALHVISALVHRSSLHGNIALELEPLGSLLEH